MKKIILSTMLLTLVLVSCNQKNKQDQTTNGEAVEASNEQYACSMHPEITGKKGDVCTECGMDLVAVVAEAPAEKVEVKEVIKVNDEVKASLSTEAMISDYLKVKNALAKDDSNQAAIFGNTLSAAITATNSDKVDAKLKDKYLSITTDAKKQAGLIADNAGKITVQRTAFASLSKDINDLIETFGTNKKLYQDYCPMYDQGKSGYWISEIKDIKNPYYGAEMLTCGGVMKEIE
jgi:hypothetical protein